MEVGVIIIIILVIICLFYILSHHNSNKLYGSGLYSKNMLINGRNNTLALPLITPEEGKILQSPPKPDEFNKAAVNTLISEISTLYNNKLILEIKNNIQINYYKNLTTFTDDIKNPFEMTKYIGNVSYFIPDLTLYTPMFKNNIIYVEYDEKNNFHSNMSDKNYKAKLYTYNNLIIRHGQVSNVKIDDDISEINPDGTLNTDINMYPMNIIVIRITYPSDINDTKFNNSAEHIKFGVLSCISHFISQMFIYTFGGETLLNDILTDGGYILYQLPGYCKGDYNINWCTVDRNELIETTKDNNPERLIDIFNKKTSKYNIKTSDILTLYRDVYINIFKIMFRPEWTNIKDINTADEFLNLVYLPE